MITITKQERTARNGSQNKPRVIVNGDDLGLSSQVNDAIFRLMESGRLSSATILANSSCFEDAVRRAKLFPQCSFGVHLCITEGVPLTSSPHLTPLLGEDGRFSGVETVHGCILTPRIRSAIKAEWNCQVDRVLDSGIPISHLDSHHHTHSLKRLFFAVKSVQRRYHIHKLRGGSKAWRKDRHNMPLVIQIRVFLSSMLVRHCGYRTKTPDLCLSPEEFASVVVRHELHLKWRYEVIAHPGNRVFPEEMQFLQGPEWEHVLRSITLINYNEL